mmetsp:Transcript_6851/g.14066  ORF Transcript_6851/g.14066 Transcript_6851/m.14066 type:complete len:329 (-) Transcript_6851:284-1270(-)
MSELARNDEQASSYQGDDEAERISRNRERNKEHARKTRLRKKEQLQALKTRVTELEAEGVRLKQEVEACNVASILVGLSSGNVSDDGVVASPSPTSFGAFLSGGKRKRFMSIDGEDSSPPPMKLNIKGQITLVGGSGNDSKTQINWKSGVYYDANGIRQQLTQSELEDLRRERNRMHAKMTRDRKKCYVASIKRVITKLEEENRQLRESLKKSTSLSCQDGASQDVNQSATQEPITTSSHSSTFDTDASYSCEETSKYGIALPSQSSLDNATDSSFCDQKFVSADVSGSHQTPKLNSSLYFNDDTTRKGTESSAQPSSMFASSIYTVG